MKDWKKEFEERFLVDGLLGKYQAEDIIVYVNSLLEQQNKEIVERIESTRLVVTPELEEKWGNARDIANDHFLPAIKKELIKTLINKQ